MKKQILASIALLTCVAASVSATIPGKTSVNQNVVGDYVEARTASVYAGACHYNGELVCTGREAVMAYNFTGGAYNGVDLSGVRAIVAVSSTASLGDDQADRKSELTVDSRATQAQVNAVKSLLEAKVGSKLGTIAAVRRTTVKFSHTDKGYSVAADGIAAMDVQPMPDNACCASPNLVWFSPISPVESQKVGFTEKATYSGNIADHWSRFGENSAFYGSFTF